MLDIRLNKEQQRVDKQLNGFKIVCLNWLDHIVINLFLFWFHDAFENSSLWNIGLVSKSNYLYQSWADTVTITDGWIWTRQYKIFLAMCEKIGDFYDNLFDCIDRHEENYNEDDGIILCLSPIWPQMNSIRLHFAIWTPF